MNISNHRTLFLFNLKVKRFREWLADIRAEQPGPVEFYAMGKLMAKILIYPRSFAQARRNYRQRLLICSHCPIFDRKLKRCRNGEDGCGCYIPFKALTPVNGWLREQGKAGCWGVVEYQGKKILS